MLQGITGRLMVGEHLTEAESTAALEAMLHPDTSDVAIASFLTALRIKGETAEEIAGFARGMRRHAVKVESGQKNLVDTAGTGGGAESFNISTTAAFVIAGAGVPVAKHGNRAVTSNSGSADVLSALGVGIEARPGEAEDCLRCCGIAFLFAPLFHPSMKRVVEIRRRLGHRTVFNLLGPLTNPASAPYQVIGVYSAALTKRVGRALSLLGTRRAWVVHSCDGMDELSSGAPTDVTEVRGPVLRSFQFKPREFGFSPAGHRDYAGGNPEENARICRGILEGQVTGPKRDVVLVNAAAALHLAGEMDFRQALQHAEESLSSGAALRKLECLIDATSRHATERSQDVE